MGCGKLYIAATPIGNLEDITARAVRVLGEAGFVAAENTMRARKLLSHCGLGTPVVPYSRGRNRRQAAGIIRRILSGEDCVFVSSAGTPGVSDPGPELVRAAAEEGIDVLPLPGPSAMCAAVSVSGVSSSNFVFLGYLSPKSGRRRKELARFAETGSALVIYESPRRLLKLFADVKAALGDRDAVVCRELTKKFEETLRGKVSSLEDVFKDSPPRGEFTVVVSGRSADENG